MLLKVFRLTLELEFGNLYLVMICKKESNLFSKGQPMKFRLAIMGGRWISSSKYIYDYIYVKSVLSFLRRTKIF